MRNPVLVFWGSAVLAAAAFAALVPLLFPFRALGLVTEADRERVWLLTVFCAGVLAVLFGASGAMGTLSYLAWRDVDEAGSVREALRKRAQAKREPGPYTRNFAVWTVATGCFLIGIYFALWLALG